LRDRYLGYLQASNWDELVARRQPLKSDLACRPVLRHGGSNRFLGVQLGSRGGTRLRACRRYGWQMTFLQVKGIGLRDEAP
jgi:hypothetical protein